MTNIIVKERRMPKQRGYSLHTKQAAILLGKQIQLGRKQQSWSEQELAKRAGISRATLQKIENGSLSCALGLVLEVATLVGVVLFNDQTSELTNLIIETTNKILLLPKRIQKKPDEVDDDF
jgi:transcriptional regulator with XRE-family HTH domain